MAMGFWAKPGSTLAPISGSLENKMIGIAGCQMKDAKNTNII
jgi:hypothetical protein